MLRSVLLKSLWDQRRSLMWWSLGLIVVALYTVLFYPSVRDMASTLDQLIESMPPALRASFAGEFTDFTSPTGYLNTQLFFIMIPMLFFFFSIGFGSGAIAGEDEKGTLELLLSNPLNRWRAVLEKFGAMVVSLATLGVALWVGIAASVIVVDMRVDLVRVAEVTLSALVLSLTFGSLALGLGCARGHRGLAMGVAAAVAVAAYLLNSLAPQVESLKAYRPLSPFYYYLRADPVANGLNFGDVSVLLGLSLAFLLIGLLLFERRDLR